MGLIRVTVRSSVTFQNLPNGQVEVLKPDNNIDLYDCNVDGQVFITYPTAQGESYYFVTGIYNNIRGSTVASKFSDLEQYILCWVDTGTPQSLICTLQDITGYGDLAWYNSETKMIYDTQEDCLNNVGGTVTPTLPPTCQDGYHWDYTLKMCVKDEELPTNGNGNGEIPTTPPQVDQTWIAAAILFLFALSDK